MDNNTDKKIRKIAIWSIVGLIGIFIGSQIFYSATTKKPYEILAKSKSLVSAGDIKGARKLLASIMTESPTAKQQYDELKLWEDSTTILAKMTEIKTSQILPLFSGKFKPKVYFHDSLNSRFTRILIAQIDPQEWLEERKLMEETERKLAIEARVNARKAYGLKLRETYLDNGMDIKVKVSGKENERLNLTYPLFNDVWVHKFKKEGIVKQWGELGFKRVDLKDGYDYHQYFTWD